jgi:hypothetical protein
MGGMGYASDDVVIRLSHDEALVLCELLHHWESQHRHVDARTVGPRDTPDASRTSTGPPIRSAAGLWMDSPGKAGWDILASAIVRLTLGIVVYLPSPRAPGALEARHADDRAPLG